MFSRDRFNLSRFSLGSHDTTLPIEVTFSDELKSVAGIAIPVETTAFFNDVVRGALRGAIATKSAFESTAALLNTSSMKANINLTFVSEERMSFKVVGSQNSYIVADLSENLKTAAYGSKTIPYSVEFCSAFATEVCGVKNIRTSLVANEVLTSVMDAGSQSTEIARFNITLPPGGEIRIDSETYRVLMNGDNILYAQSGDWLTLTRELLYIDIESATGGDLEGTMIFTERYL